MTMSILRAQFPRSETQPAPSVVRPRGLTSPRKEKFMDYLIAIATMAMVFAYMAIIIRALARAR